MSTSRRVRLSSKGQLVIPADLREQLGLQPGDELVLYLLSDRMMLAEVAAPSPFAEVAGRLREEAQAKGITRAQVEQALAEARKEVHRERQSGAARG